MSLYNTKGNRMKLTRLLFLSLACPVLSGTAESLSIDWYTVDGGGGSASAGEFTLSGTVGQPDVGTLTASGGVAIVGGYWSQFADVTVIQPERPVLNICLSNANTLLLSWPADQTGYLLEQRPAATPGVWSNVPVTPVVVGAEYQVPLTFSPNDAPTYFRLRKQ
jgi:hypothetical protein